MSIEFFNNNFILIYVINIIFTNSVIIFFPMASMSTFISFFSKLKFILVKNLTNIIKCLNSAIYFYNKRSRFILYLFFIPTQSANKKKKINKKLFFFLQKLNFFFYYHQKHLLNYPTLKNFNYLLNIGFWIGLFLINYNLSFSYATFNEIYIYCFFFIIQEKFLFAFFEKIIFFFKISSLQLIKLSLYFIITLFFYKIIVPELAIELKKLIIPWFHCLLTGYFYLNKNRITSLKKFKEYFINLKLIPIKEIQRTESTSFCKLIFDKKLLNENSEKKKIIRINLFILTQSSQIIEKCNKEMLDILILFFTICSTHSFLFKKLFRQINKKNSFSEDYLCLLTINEIKKLCNFSFNNYLTSKQFFYLIELYINYIYFLKLSEINNTIINVISLTINLSDNEIIVTYLNNNKIMENLNFLHKLRYLNIFKNHYCNNILNYDINTYNLIKKKITINIYVNFLIRIILTSLVIYYFYKGWTFDLKHFTLYYLFLSFYSTYYILILPFFDFNLLVLEKKNFFFLKLILLILKSLFIGILYYQILIFLSFYWPTLYFQISLIILLHFLSIFYYYYILKKDFFFQIITNYFFTINLFLWSFFLLTEKEILFLYTYYINQK
jgi:hypothetical protein